MTADRRPSAVVLDVVVMTVCAVLDVVADRVRRVVTS